MPTLYCIPSSAAMAPTAALEEAGADYELALVERDGTQASPEYLAINPFGRVPSLVDGELVLWESAAICMYIADKYPDSGLLPPPGTNERAVAMRWLVFLTNTVQPALMDCLYPQRLVGEGSPAIEAVRDGNRERLGRWFGHIDGVLANGQYLLGETFSVADIYLHMLTRWGRWLPHQAWSLPHLGPHYNRLSERPSVARMLEIHEIAAYPPDGS